MSQRRKRGGYFPASPGDPPPLVVRAQGRVRFGEADVMAIAWHGHYASYFEQACAELGRRCGLSYRDYFEANLRAPIVQLHIDYHVPLRLDECFVAAASLVWSEGARLNTEYTLTKEDGRTAATGYTVQMFISGSTSEFCLATPELVEVCRRRWLAGEFRSLS